jgi:hypothetical protein
VIAFPPLVEADLLLVEEDGLPHRLMRLDRP